MLENLKNFKNTKDNTVSQGKYLSTVFLMEIDHQEYLINIHNGVVVDVKTGPFVMPRWSFALRSTLEIMEEFWSERPKPGFHDLMALIKFKRMRVDGDVQLFMTHLFFIKALMESMRNKDLKS
ncbi:MAG: hypothetical protein HWE30_17945 [Methylocystaceae bacterium]|nr:hypothetical protein [Methylocystaceae bacterium]